MGTLGKVFARTYKHAVNTGLYNATYSCEILVLFTRQSNIRRDIIQSKGVCLMHTRHKGIHYVELPPCPPPALLKYRISLSVGGCKWISVHVNLDRNIPGFRHEPFGPLSLTVAIKSNGEKQTGLH
jgi:hypothetical protein